MQLETGYFNHKRWLINRLVLGSGVVAGLDVRPGPQPHSVMITPGMAIDWHGREIIVAEEAGPFPIDEAVIEKAAQLREQHSQGSAQKPQKQKQQAHH